MNDKIKANGLLIENGKCDLLDEELTTDIKKDLNKRFREKKTVPILFFSSQTQQGLTELKDLLWKQLN